MNNSWLILLLAIIAEVAGTVSMKLSCGLTRPLPTLLLFVFYAVAFALMAIALRVIPVSQCYAVWSAIGIVGISIIGVVWFNEPFDWGKAVSVLLIILGITGLTWQR